MDGGRRPEDRIRGGAHERVRHDSADKHVAGGATYVDDSPEPPGMLHLHIGWATIAAGRIASVDLSDVRAAPGVVRVLTADDAPGENDVGPVVHDEPMLSLSEVADGDGSHGRVRYFGQPLFAVAATTLAAARRAAARARIGYAEETPVLSIADAMAAGSFIAPAYRMAKGDAAAAIAAAPRRLSGRLTVGGQDHMYLEGQAATATPGEDDAMHVVSSNQHPSECQIVVARVLGVPSAAVTVEVRRLGGGFGGKETQGNLPAALAALAARLTGRPTKLRLDRDDDMIVTGKRHPIEIDYEVGFDDDGRILGLKIEHRLDCGWSTDLSNAIADRAMFHADNCYHLPAAEIVSHRCRTNTVSHTAFRGFGGPQGMMGAERVVDAIAFELGRDPLEVRRRNFYAPVGAPAQYTPYGMAVEDCVIGELVDALAVSSDYASRRAEIAAWNDREPIVKRGLALTPVRFGISFTTTWLNQAGALVLIYQDGSVALNHGGVEMGQGLYSKIAQVAADALSIDADRIRLSATRTDKVPNTSATAASSGADLNGMAVRDACVQLVDRLTRFAADRWADGDVAAVTWRPNRIEIRDQTVSWDQLVKEAYLGRVSLAASGFYATPKIHWDRAAAKGRPFYYFAYGAAVSEAAIDTLTGETRILRVDILHDVGRSLNPAIDLGQIEGGFIQGMGWLTAEELVWDAAGRLRTHAPSTYKIPTASDRPDMRIDIWAKGENRELTIKRSKAVGEPPLMLAISAHHAISDAIAAATGRRGRPALDAPATPERVLAAIDRLGAS